MAKILDLIKSLPELGRESFNFIVNPRKVVVARKLDWSRPSGVYSLAGTMMGVVLLCITLYGLIFGSLQTQLQSALRGTPLPVLEKTSTHVPQPEFVDWRLHTGFGVGIEFPQGFQKLPTEPQSALFQFGAAEFLYKGVIPDKIISGSMPLILQLLFAIFIAICIHPFAILLKGTASFSSVLKYAILLFSYTMGIASLLAIVTAVAFVEFAGLTGWVVIIPWAILVLIPMAVIGVRGYFAGYSELYTMTKKRVALSTLGAAFLSCIVSPSVLWPILHFTLKFQPYLDTLV